MANEYGISDAELNKIRQQAQRRQLVRQEFLKQRFNPWKHAAESGFVFDPAIQSFMSMKTNQYAHFKPNTSNGIFGVLAIIPFFLYGYCIWKERTDREASIRKGEIPYRDRLFKLI